MAEAGDIGQHRATTCEKGETVDVEGEFPSVGETAAEVMGTMNMVLRNPRDQVQGALEVDDGLNGAPCHEESFQWNWSNVEYSRHVAEWLRGKTPLIGSFTERITSSPAHTPSGATKSERDEEAAWEQTQALMQGVVDIATELGGAGFRYKARNRSIIRPGSWTLAGTPRACAIRWRTRSTPCINSRAPTSGFEERRPVTWESCRH